MTKFILCIVLIIGSVEVGRYAGTELYFDLLSLILIAMAALAGLLLFWKFNKLRAYIVLLALSLLIVGRVVQILPPNNFYPRIYANEQIKIKATISEGPRIGLKSTQVVLSDIKVLNEQRNWFGKLIISAPVYSDLEYGDVVVIEGKFKDLSSVEDKGYRSYLYFHHIYGKIDWPNISVVEKGSGNPLIAAGLNVQGAINEKIKKLLPQDMTSFLSGVVLGSRLPISENFDDSLKATGTNHLIVASGYNISILIACLLKITNYFRKSLSIILVIATILCYTLISGLDPSIIRATIMASLGLTAVLIGRQREAVYLLLSACFIMVLINPYWIYDAGFQLSFAATFGIISLQPFIFNKLKWGSQAFREAISTTLAAQIFVYPILITTFEQISIISLLTNMLVVWVMPIIMFGGIVLILLSFIFLPLAQLFVVMLFPALAYVENIIIVTSKLPFASLGLPGVSWLMAVMYYVVIFYLFQIRSFYENKASM